MPQKHLSIAKIPISKFLAAGCLVATIVLLLLFPCFFSCAPLSFLRPKTTTDSPPNHSAWKIRVQHRLLGTSINLGNALDAPNEGDWGTVLKDAYFSHIKSLGFQSVRIPVRWSGHIDSESPFTIDSLFFKRVLWAVDQALANNLRVIINVHHFEKLMSDPAAFSPAFLFIWKQVSERFASYGPELYFELCNEPGGAMTAETWNDLLRRTLTVIRRTNPFRSVIIGPVEWNAIRALPSLSLPADSFLITTFHYYDPMPFTHQGAPWLKGTSLWKGRRWRASCSDTALIITAFDRVDAWASKNGIPVFLGEFGALDTADTISRVLYTSFIAKQALKYGWPYAYWKYNGDFGLYDDSTDATRDFLVDALFKPESTFAAFQQSATLDTALTPDPGSNHFMLLDDFDSQKPQASQRKSRAASHSLPKVTPASLAPARPAWNVVNSGASHILSDNENPIVEGDNSDKLLCKHGKNGNCLHMKGYLRGDKYPSFAIGASLSGWHDTGAFDLSALKAISFFAKGFGAMTIDILTDTILRGYPASDRWGHFSHPFELTDDWKYYVIPVKDLKPKPFSRQQQEMLDWTAGMRKARAVSFSTSPEYGTIVDDSLDIFIDDIRLWGLTEDNKKQSAR
jgi:endoglucanase